MKFIKWFVLLIVLVAGCTKMADTSSQYEGTWFNTEKTTDTYEFRKNGDSFVITIRYYAYGGMQTQTNAGTIENNILVVDNNKIILDQKTGHLIWKGTVLQRVPNKK